MLSKNKVIVAQRLAWDTKKNQRILIEKALEDGRKSSGNGTVNF